MVFQMSQSPGPNLQVVLLLIRRPHIFSVDSVARVFMGILRFTAQLPAHKKIRDLWNNNNVAPVVCRYYFPAGHKKNVGTLLDFLFVSHFLGCSWYFQMAPRSQVPIVFHIKFEKLFASHSSNSSVTTWIINRTMNMSFPRPWKLCLSCSN